MSHWLDQSLASRCVPYLHCAIVSTSRRNHSSIRTKMRGTEFKSALVRELSYKIEALRIPDLHPFVQCNSQYSRAVGAELRKINIGTTVQIYTLTVASSRIQKLHTAH